MPAAALPLQSRQLCVRFVTATVGLAVAALWSMGLLDCCWAQRGYALLGSGTNILALDSLHGPVKPMCVKMCIY